MNLSWVLVDIVILSCMYWMYIPRYLTDWLCCKFLHWHLLQSRTSFLTGNFGGSLFLVSITDQLCLTSVSNYFILFVPSHEHVNVFLGHFCSFFVFLLHVYCHRRKEWLGKQNGFIGEQRSASSEAWLDWLYWSTDVGKPSYYKVSLIL